jgi:DNA (cytosine-5)-methyltransferase 1
VRLLDLFCGAGGAAMGYSRAGFEVVGVDINPQPNYPFEFHQVNAIRVLELLPPSHWKPVHFENFDAIHASPPCQEYSRALKHMDAPQPQLIEPVRELLEATGLPWVIENVIGSPLPNADTLDGRYGIQVCGTQVGLRVGWHRLFESNVPLRPPYPRCRCAEMHVLNPHNQKGRDRIYAEFGRQDPEAVWRRERGTEWMTRYEAREAIPPAYTELIGHQLMQHVGGAETSPPVPRPGGSCVTP